MFDGDVNVCGQAPEPCWHRQDRSTGGRLPSIPPGWAPEAGSPVSWHDFSSRLVFTDSLPFLKHHFRQSRCNDPKFIPPDPRRCLPACVAPGGRVGLQVHPGLYCWRWGILGGNCIFCKGLPYLRCCTCVITQPREPQRCTPSIWWRPVCRIRGPPDPLLESWCIRTALIVPRRCFATRASLAFTEVKAMLRKATGYIWCQLLLINANHVLQVWFPSS